MALISPGMAEAVQSEPLRFAANTSAPRGSSTCTLSGLTLIEGAGLRLRNVESMRRRLSAVIGRGSDSSVMVVYLMCG